MAASASWTRDSMDCDLVCLSDGWIANVAGPAMRPASMRNSATQFSANERCHHHSHQAIGAAHDSGNCARTGCSFSTRACRAAAFSKSRLAEASSRWCESSRSSDWPPLSRRCLHALHFLAVLIIAAALEARRQAHLHFQE